MWKIKCKVGTFGINYSQKNTKLSLYYYSNLLELQENYLSIIIPIFWNLWKIIFYYYSNLLELVENYFSIIIPIYWNWWKIISLLLFQSIGIGGKLFLYYFIPIYWNWGKIISLLLFQSFGIGGKLFFIILLQSFGIGGKFPNKIAKFLQQFLYTLLFLPYFGNCGGKNVPILMNKIFNNKYFTDE